MSLTQTVSPTAQPVRMQDLRLHLRHTEDSELRSIESYLESATLTAQAFSGRQYMTATWVQTFDSFPLMIRLFNPPLQSVTSITYIDTNGDSQTLSSAVYTVDTSTEPGRVYEAYNQQWPSTRDQRDAVTVTYVAGYSSIDTVPSDVKLAIMQIAAQANEYREPLVLGTSLASVPDSARSLLWHNRIMEFA